VFDAPHPAPGETLAPVEPTHDPADLGSAPPVVPAPVLPAVPEPRHAAAPDLLDGLFDDGQDTLSLVLDGAVDARLEAELAEILNSIRSSGVRHIVLEMATVTSMDAAGLRFLFAVRALVDERSGTLRLADPADAVRDLVTEAGVGSMLGLDDTDLGGLTDDRPQARPA
jgi:anti-anti-sigma factor